MANTYTLIASSTVGSGGTSQIDFTSIPSTYTDLLVRYTARNNSNNYGTFFMRINDTTSTYTAKRLQGTGSAAQSNSANSFIWNASDSTASTFASGDIYIPNYTSSNQKSVSFDGVSENNATSAFSYLTAWLWNGTSAITKLSFGTFDGSYPNDYFVQYSTFYLYGISNS
jgi:hypothetical protein